jgi:hypothetical protein
MEPTMIGIQKTVRSAPELITNSQRNAVTTGLQIMGWQACRVQANSTVMRGADLERVTVPSSLVGSIQQRPLHPGCQRVQRSSGNPSRSLRILDTARTQTDQNRLFC